jgi:hypothetical protein
MLKFAEIEGLGLKERLTELTAHMEQLSHINLENLPFLDHFFYSWDIRVGSIRIEVSD